MSTPLRILMVEDDENDAELTRLALTRSGLSCDVRRVDEAGAFDRELRFFHPQLIISDFNLPRFDGFEALAVARERCPQVPFIFASGTIGQARAEKALELGAAWYVEKGNFSQLADYVRGVADAAKGTEAKK